MQQFGGDEDDRDSGGKVELGLEPIRTDAEVCPGSADGSSDEEEKDGHGNAEAMEVDAEAEADGEENEFDNDDNDDDDDEPDQEGLQDSFAISNTQRTRTSTISQPSLSGTRSTQGSFITAGTASLGPTSHPNPTAPQSSMSHINSPLVRIEALTAPVYDIVPTIAAPHSTSINAITATPDLRWVFSGGADGYIRKFNWVETANGKSMLTVAQKHPFVDSVTKAGVLMSYWENEDSQRRFSLSHP